MFTEKYQKVYKNSSLTSCKMEKQEELNIGQYIDSQLVVALDGFPSIIH